MKKIILKFSVLMIAIFLSVLFVAPAMLYATPVTQQAIPGVTAPVTGVAPVTTITASDQYTGTVAWEPVDNPFSGGTVYTATITLTVEGTYDFEDVPLDWFTVDGADGVANAAGLGSGLVIEVIAVFPATAATDVVITTPAITGVTAPVTGATPVLTIAETAEYTATIAWNGSPATFAASTAYTATITITPKTGYILTGVAANFFTVAGATATNDINTGVVSAVFPATAAPVPLLVQPTVNLGTTSSFAVLAGETITNTGPTTISGSSPEGGGNVGLQPGSDFPGQADVTMTGWTVYLSDPAGVALQAKNDLVVAYLDAAGRTPTTTFAATDNQLGGQTLKSGVYAFGHADTANLTGTLTLDAEGNENAVFIFQASSDLITASGSNVNLINGARYCRVFWQVTSSATLGTNSAFVGHIFALTSITATTGATVQGQLLARNGAVTLDTNTITNGLCITPAAITAATTAATTAAITAATTETTPAPVTQTVTGGEIPKTSTPWYNVLIAGAALMLIGAMGWWITRKVYV